MVTLGHSTIPERIAYARELRKLPIVLSADEEVSHLEAVPRLKSPIALTRVYATGLLADVDSKRMGNPVRKAKAAGTVCHAVAAASEDSTDVLAANPTDAGYFLRRDSERALDATVLHAALRRTSQPV